MAVRPLRIDEDVVSLEAEGNVAIPGETQTLSPTGPRPLRDNEEVLPLEQEEPGFGAKIAGRFLGTDVDDPQELSRMGATVVGAIGGGILGTKVSRAPGPLGVLINPATGAFTFGLVGAVTGAVAPETALTVAEGAGLVPAGTRAKLGLSSEDLRTVIEGEALLEVATFGGISALRLTGRGAAKLFTGLNKATAETAERAAQREIALLPVQVGKGQLARGYIAVIGRFPWIGSPIRKAAQKAEIETIQSLHKTAERVGPISAWTDISESIFSDAKTLLKKVNDSFSVRYEDIWRQADELNVTVTPDATLDKASEILAKIEKGAPVDASGKTTSAGPALEKVSEFIKTEILPLRGTVDDATTTASQTLRQMDGLLTKLDQEIASFEPGQKRFANSLMVQLRQSVQLDMVGNLKGTAGDVIRAELKAADTEFSHTMSQIFETSTANKFASVKKRGLRAIGAEKLTRTPIDQLSRVVVKLESPQAIDELARLVSKDTMQAITSTTVDDAIVASQKKGRFNADTFTKRLGLDNLDSPKAKALEKLLEHSENPLTVKEFADFAEAARVISDVEIPNVSTFIARRATIGGVKAILTGIIPGLALAGGAAWSIGGLVGAMTFIGGTRLISAVISNPASAKALKNVLDVESTTVVRRNAWLRAIRLGINSLDKDDKITEKQKFNMEQATKFFMLEMNEQLKELTGEDE